MASKKCDNNFNCSQFTWQQVAEHNHINSAWVINCRTVYDVTSNFAISVQIQLKWLIEYYFRMA